MKIIDKYNELLNSPDVIKYIGNSNRRRITVKVITGLVIVIFVISAIFIISAGIRIMANYLF